MLNLNGFRNFWKSYNFIFVALFTRMPLAANAADEITPKQYCYEESPSGVMFDDDKLIVVHRTPISITGDRKALYRAFIKAELRAKGVLTRALAEKHSTTLTSTDSVEDITGTRQIVDASGKLSSEEVTSKQKDALIMLESNVSSADYVGLRKFEESYNAESGEVCVAVGTSPEIVTQVNRFKNLMSNPGHVSLQKKRSKVDNNLKSFHRKSTWK